MYLAIIKYIRYFISYVIIIIKFLNYLFLLKPNAANPIPNIPTNNAPTLFSVNPVLGSMLLNLCGIGLFPTLVLLFVLETIVYVLK